MVDTADSWYMRNPSIDTCHPGNCCGVREQRIDPALIKSLAFP